MQIYVFAVLLAGLFSLPAASKNVHVHVLGGTIVGSSTSPDPYITSEYSIGSHTQNVTALVFDLLDDGKLFNENNVTVNVIANIGSHEITPELIRDTAIEIQQSLDGSADAVVLLTGSDSCSEVAGKLDDLVYSEKPLVVVASMRPPGVVASDAHRNARNGLAVAIHHMAKHRPAMIVHDDIIDARYARKFDASDINAIQPLRNGYLGRFIDSEPFFFSPPSPRPKPTTHIDPKTLKGDPPRVPLVLLHIGLTIDMVKAMLPSGTKGAVIAGFGQGNCPDELMPPIRALKKEGATIYMATRAQSGIILDNGPFSGCLEKDILQCHLEATFAIWANRESRERDKESELGLEVCQNVLWLVVAGLYDDNQMICLIEGKVVA